MDIWIYEQTWASPAAICFITEIIDFLLSHRYSVYLPKPNGGMEEKKKKTQSFITLQQKKKKQKCIDFIQRNSSLAWRLPFLEANAMCILDIYMPFLL